jgi:membrane protein YqaA with SNARE-associated domain
MEIQALIDHLGLPAAVLIVCFISGLVFVVNAEIFLVLVATQVSPLEIPLLILMATVGQMTAKALVFYGGRGGMTFFTRRHEARIEAMRAAFHAKERRAGPFILLSALVGFPPFYVVSFVAGALVMTFTLFLVAGAIGRAIRFGIVMFAGMATAEWLF